MDRQGDENTHSNDSSCPSGLLHTGCLEELSRNLLLLPFCRLCETSRSGAADCSGSVPLQAWLEVPLLSQVSAAWPWQLREGAVTQEPLPVTRKEIQPLLQTRVSASQITGGIFNLSDKAGDSRSLLLLRWAYAAKISPSYLNLTATLGNTKVPKKKS